MRETVAAMRELWANQEAGYDGVHVKVAPSWSWPKPTRPAGPPVLMGCQGRIGLRHVAEYADEWCPMDIGFRDVAKGLQWFRDAAAAADRDPDGIPVSMYCFNPPTAATIEQYAVLGIQRVVLSAPDEADKHQRFLDRCQPLVDGHASRN